MLIKKLIKTTALCALISSPINAVEISRWYGDNNLTSGQNPPGAPIDFLTRYETSNQASWSYSRLRMDTFCIKYKVYDTHLKYAEVGDDVWNLSSDLANVHNNIPVCFNTVAATWAHHLGNDLSFKSTKNAIKRLLNCGWNCKYIALQSVLSKPYPNGSGWNANQLPERVSDIVAFFRVFKTAFPDIEIGLIDAMPAQGKDYQSAYTMLKDELALEGYTLDFFLNDFPNNWPTAGNNSSSTFNDLIDSNSYAQSLNWKTGWFMSVFNANNAQQYQNSILDGLDTFLSMGGEANVDFILTDAFDDHPEYSAPDDPDPVSNPNGVTQLATFVMADQLIADYKLDGETCTLESSVFPGYYLDVDPGYSVDCNNTRVRSDSKWILRKQNNGYWVIESKTFPGRYLTAETDFSVNCNGTAINMSTQWALGQQQDGVFTLESRLNEGRFLDADTGYQVDNNKTQIRNDTKWKIVIR